MLLELVGINVMISIGVYKAQHLHDLRVDSYLGRRRNFAIDLLEEIDLCGNEEIKRAYIESLADGTNIAKLTYSDRFPAFDRALANHVSRLYLARPVRVLDAAVSDGSTSLDLFNLLCTTVGPELFLTATDRDGRYLVLRQKSRPDRRVVVSHYGEIVQVVWPPFVFGGRSNERAFPFPINWFVRPSAMRFAKDMIDRWAQQDSEVEEIEIYFLSREFRNLLSSDPRVNFLIWDIMTPWTQEKTHCVRAMNILNPSYFHIEQIRRIVENLMAAVIEGGIVALGSNGTAGSEVDGAIYQRDGEQLVELAAFGNGFRCREAIGDRVKSAHQSST